MANERITDVPVLSDAEKATAVVPVVNRDDDTGDWRKILFRDLLSLSEFQTETAYMAGETFYDRHYLLYVVIADIPATNTEQPSRLSQVRQLVIGAIRSFARSGSEVKITATDIDTSIPRWTDLVRVRDQLQAAIDAIDTSGSGSGVSVFMVEPIGTWTKHETSGDPAVGRYKLDGLGGQVVINKTDQDSNDQSATLEAIENRQAITFGSFTFVIESRIRNTAEVVEWAGYWADGVEDTIEDNAQVNVGHIPHRVDMTGLLNEHFSNLPRELEEETEARESADDRLEDLTVDIHLQDSPGVFADVTDSAVAGIGLIENTSANRSALDARTFNFGSVTWMNPSADIPDDGNDYWVVVRVALSLGHIETEFQLINDDPEEGTERLRRSRQADADWYYYQVSADLESVWTLQRRTTSSHTRWDAPLGDIPLQQIQDLGFHGDGLTQDDIARALVPYGFSFIGVYPRYARLDQFQPENNWVIALGEVYPPFNTAGHLEVNVNGVPIYRNVWSSDEKFILFSVGATNADNIESNTAPEDTHWPFVLIFRTASDGDEVGRRTIPVVINRDAAPSAGSGLTTEERNRLLPTPPPPGSRNNKIAKFTADVLQWIEDAEGGAGLTPLERDTFASLIAKLADVSITSTETWANAGSGGLVGLGAGITAITSLGNGQVPSGVSGWSNNITTTTNRVIVVRVPIAEDLADYRVLFADGTWVRLDAWRTYAVGTTWKYIAAPDLTRLTSGQQIRLQHHGENPHTRFNGTLADAIMQRLNPLIPDEGDRNGKVPQWVDDDLMWRVLDFVTEEEFGNRQRSTPNRGTTLPAYLNNKELFVLESTSHFSDERFDFSPVAHTVSRAQGGDLKYYGTNVLAFSTDLPAFGTTDASNIFRADRIAAIYSYERLGNPQGGSGVRWQPKIVFDKALFPDTDTYGSGFLKLRWRFDNEPQAYLAFHEIELEASSFDANDSSGSVQELTFGGKTYICKQFAGSLSGNRAILDNAATLGLPLGIQITQGQSADGMSNIKFLSNDLATPWVDGTETPAGLYEGDANGHPIAAVVPPKSVWDEVVATSGTFIRGGAPNNRFGVPGNRWLDLSNGKGYIKQTNNTWLEVVDFALQAEVTALNARVLPALPAEGSRNDKILRFADDALGWEDLAVATGSPDGKVIFGTTSAPAGSLGKIGDTYLRRISAERISLYEKTGASAWTYRYDILLLPAYPSTGSRDDKILRFDGNALGWEDMPASSGGGITADQIARLLPTLPATGSRNDRFPIFNNNTLGWESFPTIGTTTAWSSIASGSPITIGRLVHHGGRTFACIRNHNRSGTGPDGDSTNWLALTNWAGTWTAAWYPAGLFVERNGFPYVARQNVSVNDVAPDHASNTKWLRLGVDLSLLLPTLPAAGSRDDKILRFSGNNLGWEDLAAAGGLPTAPASGSRDGKFPQYNGNSLAWEDRPHNFVEEVSIRSASTQVSFTTTSEAIPLNQSFRNFRWIVFRFLTGSIWARTSEIPNPIASDRAIGVIPRSETQTFVISLTTATTNTSIRLRRGDAAGTVNLVDIMGVR